jgi:hypothetical protein
MPRCVRATGIATDGAVKVAPAVGFVPAMIAIVHVGVVPVQAPDHPVKVDPDVGTAFSTSE